MKINDVHHVAITTKDFEKSKRFYTEVLGLELVNEVDLGGDYVAYIKYADDSFLELFRTKSTEELPINDNRAGLRHIAFDVDNIDIWNCYLKECHVPYRLDMTDISPIKKRVLLIEAPDNVVVELCQTIV